MKKRITIIILSFIILIILFAIIINIFKKEQMLNKDKLNIVVTLYPEYDFVKAIVGDKAEVIQILAPGVEAHTYEPSVQDRIKIENADLFIYTADSMEPWARSIINSTENYKMKVVDCSGQIDMINTDEFMEEYSLLEEHEHSHDGIENLDHELDGHIWMDPQNAIKMIDTILIKLVEIDSNNAEFYIENAKNYKEKIAELDAKIESELQEANVDKLVFGGEFAYAYFCKRYNLKVVSCYSACGEGAEPSVQDIKDVIDFINNNKVDKVFYEELSEGKVAQMLSEETNAKPVVFNTIHNVTKKEFEAGTNYISIMEANLKALTK